MDQHTEVREEVLALLERHQETRGRDDVLLPHRTELYWVHRR